MWHIGELASQKFTVNTGRADRARPDEVSESRQYSIDFFSDEKKMKPKRCQVKACELINIQDPGGVFREKIFWKLINGICLAQTLTKSFFDFRIRSIIKNHNPQPIASIFQTKNNPYDTDDQPLRKA